MVGCLSAEARGFSQYIPTLVGILERTSYEVRDEGLNFAYLYAGKYHERDHVRLTDDDADCLRGVETGRQKTPLLIVVEHLPKKRHVPINKFKVPRPDTTANSSTPVQPDTDICGIRQCALSASDYHSCDSHFGFGGTSYGWRYRSTHEELLHLSQNCIYECGTRREI